MKNLLAILLLLAPGWALAADYDEFRACVMESADASARDSFHHCSAPLVGQCAAAKTAKEAVACIDEARFEMEREIVREYDGLLAQDPEAKDNMDALVANMRDGGENACLTMQHADEAMEVPVGQRAVNAAFCLFVATGDVLGLLVRLEPK